MKSTVSRKKKKKEQKSMKWEPEKQNEMKKLKSGSSEVSVKLTKQSDEERREDINYQCQESQREHQYRSYRHWKDRANCEQC